MDESVWALLASSRFNHFLEHCIRLPLALKNVGVDARYDGIYYLRNVGADLNKLVLHNAIGGRIGSDLQSTGIIYVDGDSEPLIEQFKQSVLNDVSRTTCNRYLSTLKKALRHAQRKLKLIDKLPVIELYGKEEGAERECEFVYTTEQYQGWLKAAREPLRSASILAHDGGICRGEMLSLKRDCVQLKDSADDRGFWGTIAIRRGLKRAARRREIPITEDMAAVLGALLAESKCEYVFTSLHNHAEPLSANTLADQHRAIMETCSFHPDAGLHALRHTFLTEAGRHTQNVRALQKLAGHSRIETTMRYVHPDQEDMLEIVAQVQVARTGRIQAVPATVSATASGQQAAESRKI